MSLKYTVLRKLKTGLELDCYRDFVSKCFDIEADQSGFQLKIWNCNGTNIVHLSRYNNFNDLARVAYQNFNL
jgi:hypothetical protein